MDCLFVCLFQAHIFRSNLGKVLGSRTLYSKTLKMLPRTKCRQKRFLKIREIFFLLEYDEKLAFEKASVKIAT